MIIKCPSCDGALEFNPQTGKMECKFCGNSYENEPVNIVETEKKSEPHKIFNKRETMECNIYTCTACGAKLAVNRVETSSFCAYCGQPTIVFSRVSQELKPDGIIPFQITGEQAYNTVRAKFAKGIMLPKAIKEFRMEQMRGIYIPYFIYDIDYRDTKCLTGKVPVVGGQSKKYFIRKAEGNFRGIVYDASKQLNDESAIRLEPYDLSGLKPFTPEYLSGFYADKCDLNQEETEACGVARAKNFFDTEMRKSVKADYITMHGGNPSYEVKNITYALFPVWFLTFRYKNEPYTILINGQTGKMVGSVPVDKTNMWLCFFISLFGISVLSMVIFAILAMFPAFSLIVFIVLTFIFVASTFFTAKAFSDYKKIRQNVKYTRTWATARFVKERQGRT